MICNVIYIIIEMIKCTHNYIGQKGFASAHALINIKRTFHYVIMIAFKDRWDTIKLIDYHQYYSHVPYGTSNREICANIYNNRLKWQTIYNSN